MTDSWNEDHVKLKENPCWHKPDRSFDISSFQDLSQSIKDPSMDSFVLKEDKTANTTKDRKEELPESQFKEKEDRDQWKWDLTKSLEKAEKPIEGAQFATSPGITVDEDLFTIWRGLDLSQFNWNNLGNRFRKSGDYLIKYFRKLKYWFDRKTDKFFGRVLLHEGEEDQRLIESHLTEREKRFLVIPVILILLSILTAVQLYWAIYKVMYPPPPPTSNVPLDHFHSRLFPGYNAPHEDLHQYFHQHPHFKPSSDYQTTWTHPNWAQIPMDKPDNFYQQTPHHEHN